MIKTFASELTNGILIAGLILCAVLKADAQPLPQPLRPGGSCPFGYTASGGYCVPSAGASDSIPKSPSGSCPWGWTASGSFCIRSGK